jgi:hypothetical protein
MVEILVLTRSVEGWKLLDGDDSGWGAVGFEDFEG